MKCGRLRSSNCFAVFFPLPAGRGEQFAFLCVRLDPFLPFLSVLRPLVLSSFCRYTLRRISTYTTPRLSSVLLSSRPPPPPLNIPVRLRLPSDSYSAFLDFFISSLCVLPSLRSPLSRDCFFVSFLRVSSITNSRSILPMPSRRYPSDRFPLLFKPSLSLSFNDCLDDWLFFFIKVSGL